MKHPKERTTVGISPRLSMWLTHNLWTDLFAFLRICHVHSESMHLSDDLVHPSDALTPLQLVERRKVSLERQWIRGCSTSLH